MRLTFIKHGGNTMDDKVTITGAIVQSYDGHNTTIGIDPYKVVERSKLKRWEDKFIDALAQLTKPSGDPICKLVKLITL